MKKFIVTLLVLAALGSGAYFGRDFILPNLGQDRLTITMNSEATDISPYGLNLNNITRTGNIYQGLVDFDRNLRVVPALAVSWGNINDTTWEFRLREGVKFHDGSDFVAQDVVDAYEKAKSSGNVQIEPHIETIREMTVRDGRLIVTTFAPDPLLLSKLSKLFVYKEGDVGTGPYKLKRWVPGSHMDLTAFRDYWGSKPTFGSVRYEVETNRADRQNNFASGDIDILASVPQEQALTLPETQVKTGYGLEVNFLMFKLDDPVLKDIEIRESIQKLISPRRIESIGNDFVRAATQFVAPGVFGYNQDIEAYEYDFANEPRDLFGVRLQRVELDYLSTFRTLSEYLSEQLRKAGFSVTEVPNEPDELLAKVEANESQMYLIGWRAADGDAGSFFDAFIHSEGVFNGGRYVNEELDRLIEEARREMEPQVRLALLKQIGAKLQEDLIGIPLFETSRLYAVQENIKWEPRLDGAILAAEVSK